MFKFIGSGSAFNTKLGNNSAYYKKDNQMLLIDCGSNIFQRIKESNLLEGIDHIHVAITHTHADHVGSLADLILYTYYSHGEFAKPKVTAYSVFDINLNEVLKLNGCTKDVHYTSIQCDELDKEIEIKGLEDLNFFFFKSTHVNEIPSYSIEFGDNEYWTLYTGDTNSLDDVALENINNEKGYRYAYVDTCKADYEGNVHLSLRKLTELIKPEYRHKVWCMHLDEGFIREEAKNLGFNVVTNEF